MQHIKNIKPWYILLKKSLKIAQLALNPKINPLITFMVTYRYAQENGTLY